MKNVRFALAGALVTTCAAFGEITIRSDYPGGNVKICGIDEANGVVRFAPDLRDTQGRWFHWDFTLRGAAGRKIYFLLPDDKWQYISSLGPAISKDGGRTWTWLRPDGTRHEPANAFDYTFGPDENETRFAVSIPYAQKDWDAFIAKWRGKGVECGVLCKSQSGTRDTELLRIPCRKAAKWLFAFTARHHACETSANAPMEGVVEAILSGTPEGEWLRDNADCVFVLKGRYTSVRALKELLVKESEGKQIVFVDMHSPHVRSLPSCPEQDQVFTFGCRDERLNAHWNEFRKNWKETQKGGTLVYDGKYDIFAGKGYAVTMEKQWAAGFMSSDPWVRTLPNCYLATCCEFGYSLCGGVYSFPAARELGRNMLKALVRTAQASEKP